MRTQSAYRTILYQEEEEIELMLAFVAFDLAMSHQLEKLERRWASAHSCIGTIPSSGSTMMLVAPKSSSVRGCSSRLSCAAALRRQIPFMSGLSFAVRGGSKSLAASSAQA